MAYIYKYSQSTPLRKPDPLLPNLSNHSMTIDEEHQRNASLRNRIQELEGNMHMLQKKYKGNLKSGFQNKIRSFRLQAVLERKVFKDTLESARQHFENEQLHSKMKRAQQVRLLENERLQSIDLRLKQKRKKAHEKAEQERQQAEYKIRQQQERALSCNKQTHDRIFSEVKNNDKKKKYFQKIKKQKFQKQTYEQKQDYINKILTNQEILSKLKQQLVLLSEQTTSSMNPFITI